MSYDRFRAVLEQNAFLGFFIVIAVFFYIVGPILLPFIIDIISVLAGVSLNEVLRAITF